MTDEIRAEQTKRSYHHHESGYSEYSHHYNYAESLDDEKTQESDRKSYYRPSIERLRLILMFFACINLSTASTTLGRFIQTLCCFAPITFFVLSGFLVLRESKHRSERIKRAIKRSAIAFVGMTAAYFVLDFFYYRTRGINILPDLGTGKFWIDFLLMNVWKYSLGSAIWYVQALLYAYVIIFFLDKLNLLKLDRIIFFALLLITVLFGELSGFFNWNIAGYTHIPGNFLTRALPYILLGGFMHRRMEKFQRIPRIVYLIGIPGGILAAALEMVLLDHFGVQGYYGHLIGLGLTAVSIGMVVFNAETKSGFEAKLGLTRKYTNIIYYICQPVFFALCIAVSKAAESYGQNISANVYTGLGIVTFVICFCFVWLLAIVGDKKAAKSKQ